PLMSPILGVGLSVATLDRQLLKTSVGSLGIATFVSLLTSVIYFLISPFAEMTSELSARTTPTILDIGVAFFGGVAGVVAG
ncbi:MAG TPA: TIGR00341 family protein, partial [Blastocatellia bacterium]|nr:TIGR00341 family protein [Blastocatellia bacterium]